MALDRSWQLAMMRVMQSNESRDADPIAQLEIVLATWRNRGAALVGAVAGLIPYGAYEIGHHELSSWNPTSDGRALIVYACLAFSVLTVVDWAHQVFDLGSSRGARTLGWIKALGFTAGVEAIMMTSTDAYLPKVCLGLLIAINAVANGCRLAVRSAARKATSAERAAVRAPARKRPVPTKLRAVQ